MEFELNGEHYRTAKMDVLRQFHTSRKIGVILPKLVPIFTTIAREGQALAKLDKAAAAEYIMGKSMAPFLAELEPFMEALSGMSQTDSEFVVNECLGTVLRKVGNNYVKIGSASTLQFDDIELDIVMQIVIKVLWDNLGPFIKGFLSKSPTEASPAV